MTQPLLHTKTAMALDHIVARPPHAVLLVAPPGAGKATIGRVLAARLLGVDWHKIAGHAYYKELTPKDGKAIYIELIREVTHFLTLQAPGKTDTARVVLIEQAQLLTVQAQNALLKTIEEPPAATVLILTVPSEMSILPTIRSRTQMLHIQLPDGGAMTDYFKQAGYTAGDIARSILMSDGLPGLTQALLEGDAAHPLVAASARAKEILQKPLFERIVSIDALVKEKQEWLDTLFMLQRMAHLSLQNRQATTTSMKRWHAILKASHEAYEQTISSGQAKLVALHFMLSW